jgi:hypothetical protein
MCVLGIAAIFLGSLRVAHPRLASKVLPGWLNSSKRRSGWSEAEDILVGLLGVLGATLMWMARWDIVPYVFLCLMLLSALSLFAALRSR